MNFFFYHRSDESRGEKVGFAHQLHLLIDALVMSFKGKFMEDFVSGLYIYDIPTLPCKI